MFSTLSIVTLKFRDNVRASITKSAPALQQRRIMRFRQRDHGCTDWSTPSSASLRVYDEAIKHSCSTRINDELGISHYLNRLM